jgi:ABC-type proline/glycine betaine transport system permease subunit
MNSYILIAAIFCIMLGLVHSFLGEYLIFKTKRKKGNFIPSIVSSDLTERHLRIVWATWHLTSLFGLLIGILLFKIASEHSALSLRINHFILESITYTMFTASLLVLVGTRGKHPAWVVLILIGIILILGT